MKLHLPAIITSLFLAVATLTPALALEPPRIVPRMQEIQKPIDAVYEAMKKYFTDSSLSHFQLVSADPKTRTLVAKQVGVDNESWTKWAFCETGPVQMIYKLEDGTVVVTVKLRKSTRHATFASVSADFEGTYGLGANQNKVGCTSKFALEDNLLAVAGAAHGK